MDLTDLGNKLAGASVSFDGNKSGVVAGGDVTAATNGKTTYNKADLEGDSGGAYLLSYGSTSYVLGTINSRNTAGTESYGTYF